MNKRTLYDFAEYFSRFEVGTRIPIVGVVSEQVGYNEKSVKDAYKHFKKEGLLRSGRGCGVVMLKKVKVNFSDWSYHIVS